MLVCRCRDTLCIVTAASRFLSAAAARVVLYARLQLRSCWSGCVKVAIRLFVPPLGPAVAVVVVVDDDDDDDAGVEADAKGDAVRVDVLPGFAVAIALAVNVLWSSCILKSVSISISFMFFFAIALGATMVCGHFLLTGHI